MADDARQGGKAFDRESIRNVLISATSVILRPLQERNETLNRKQNVLTVAGLMAPGVDVAAQFESIETRIVDLATGEYTDAIDPAVFDMVEAAEDPALSVAIPPPSRESRNSNSPSPLETLRAPTDGSRSRKISVTGCRSRRGSQGAAPRSPRSRRERV